MTELLNFYSPAEWKWKGPLSQRNVGYHRLYICNGNLVIKLYNFKHPLAGILPGDICNAGTLHIFSNRKQAEWLPADQIHHSVQTSDLNVIIVFQF